MKISIHWYEFTTKHMSEDALQELCTLLDITLSAFETQVVSNGVIYRYAVPHSGVAESLYIKNPSNRESYGVVKVKGSYWEQNPDIPFDLLHKFAKEHNGNTKRIDIAFDDDQRKLPFKEIIRVSHKDTYKQNIVGTAVSNRKKKREYNKYPDQDYRLSIPDYHANHGYIHYGDSSSGANVKIYNRSSEYPYIRVELTLQNPDHINALLAPDNEESVKDFCSDSMTLNYQQLFFKLCQAVLVKTLNFCTPKSIESRHYEQTAWWKAFLTSEVAPLQWSTLSTTGKAQKESFDAAIKRVRASMTNLCGKFKLTLPAEELDQLLGIIELQFWGPELRW